MRGFREPERRPEPGEFVEQTGLAGIGKPFDVAEMRRLVRRLLEN